MIAFYAQIKLFHMCIALTSGAFFALRGACLLGGARWPLAAPVRWLSYGIDTALLTAALMLLTILPGAIFANGWLTTKLVLVAIYIMLGVFALKWSRTPRARLWFYLAALVTFAAIYSIARAHHPLGFLSG